MRYFIDNTFIRYGVVGSCAALLELVLLTFNVEILGMKPVIASTCALAISIAFNYIFQRRVTFRSNSKHYIAGPRFLAITLSTLATNAAMFSALVLYIPYLAAQVVTIGAIFPINYLLNKRITFRA